MLKKGDKAPYFEGITQDGEKISSNNYVGKKFLVYFYPKASTPGCTAEACSLRDGKDILFKKGYSIIGISADDESKQKKFSDKNELNFPLIADTNKEIIKSFGVWGPKKFMGKTYDGILRTTFLIDEKGLIEEVITKVKTKDHANQILAFDEQ